MTAKNSTGITSDFYLDLLKLGRERSLEGVTEEEVLKLAKKHGYFTDNEIQEVGNLSSVISTNDPKTAKTQKLLLSLFTESFVYGDKARALSSDSYFKLLEHEELELARENAQSAKIYSTWAIIIALISLLVSVIQAGKPITLNDTQYQGIVNTESVDSIAKRMDALNRKLDTLIKAAEAVGVKSTKQK